ncbi:hypothetical protein BC828DRAFT_374623 [Blastocladiella britannica]|nr:hypothetical protein BC828DRAFT_374623 [Blastocladiella britannica]
MALGHEDNHDDRVDHEDEGNGIWHALRRTLDPVTLLRWIISAVTCAMAHSVMYKVLNFSLPVSLATSLFLGLMIFSLLKAQQIYTAELHLEQLHSIGHDGNANGARSRSGHQRGGVSSLTDLLAKANAAGQAVDPAAIIDAAVLSPHSASASPTAAFGEQPQSMHGLDRTGTTPMLSSGASASQKSGLIPSLGVNGIPTVDISQPSLSSSNGTSPRGSSLFSPTQSTPRSMASIALPVSPTVAHDEPNGIPRMVRANSFTAPSTTGPLASSSAAAPAPSATPPRRYFGALSANVPNHISTISATSITPMSQQNSHAVLLPSPLSQSLLSSETSPTASSTVTSKGNVMLGDSTPHVSPKTSVLLLTPSRSGDQLPSSLQVPGTLPIHHNGSNGGSGTGGSGSNSVWSASSVLSPHASHASSLLAAAAASPPSPSHASLASSTVSSIALRAAAAAGLTSRASLATAITSVTSISRYSPPGTATPTASKDRSAADSLSSPSSPLSMSASTSASASQSGTGLPFPPTLSSASSPTGMLTPSSSLSPEGITNDGVKSNKLNLMSGLQPGTLASGTATPSNGGKHVPMTGYSLRLPTFLSPIPSSGVSAETVRQSGHSVDGSVGSVRSAASAVSDLGPFISQMAAAVTGRSEGDMEASSSSKPTATSSSSTITTTTTTSRWPSLLKSSTGSSPSSTQQQQQQQQDQQQQQGVRRGSGGSSKGKRRQSTTASVTPDAPPSAVAIEREAQVHLNPEAAFLSSAVSRGRRMSMPTTSTGCLVVNDPAGPSATIVPASNGGGGGGDLATKGLNFGPTRRVRPAEVEVRMALFSEQVAARLLQFLQPSSSPTTEQSQTESDPARAMIKSGSLHPPEQSTSLIPRGGAHVGHSAVSIVVCDEEGLPLDE